MCSGITTLANHHKSGELPYLFQDFKKHVALVGAPAERFAAVAGARDTVQVLGTAKAFETRYG
jgi:hypothetical protein